jgi:manganese efflux pump family protein
MPAAAPSTSTGAMGLVTLLTWLFTMSLGAYMLRSVVRHGGLRQQRAVRDGLHPGVLIGHFSLAATGFAVWVSYVLTGWDALAWSAVSLLAPTIGLGICTVTLWTPYPRSPAPGSGVTGSGPARDTPASGRAPTGALRGRTTDAMLERALTDDALAARLIDDVIASLPAEPPGRRRPRAYPVAVLPFGHGLAAVTTFTLAVLTATGAR